MPVATPLTTLEEMEQECGEDAIRGWADNNEDGDHDDVRGTADATVDRAISRATKEIVRLAQRYSAAAMAADEEIRSWATILACYYLCKSRGNDPLQSLADDVAYIREQLAMIRSGGLTLDVPLKADLRPTMSNRIVDRRHRYRTVRKRPDSTGPRSVLREDRVDSHEVNE